MVVAFAVTEISNLMVTLFWDLTLLLLVFIFAVLSFFAAQFALFLTKRQKRLWISQARSSCYIILHIRFSRLGALLS